MLFCNDYGKRISYSEKKMLVELTDKAISPKGHLGDSHLFKLLQWNPQAIKTIAGLWRAQEHMSLSSLYQTVAHHKSEDPVACAIFLQLKDIKKWEAMAYQLLCMI